MTHKQISLTDAAARRVESFLQREGGAGLRLGVRRTGCSGWAYVVDLAGEVLDSDEVFEDRGVRILVDREALPLLAGTQVDFVQQGLNHTFEFSNPNVTDECGCGESFAVASSV
ncbi:MAG: iron-sulfur cluster assembly accessory protein [Wenzhouxiangellaceae bacterium]|nr:iron-sulfur cluster assembly accessory protein [Wenzhouxiangellaceae bacterium]MBS3823218.1 iron-sulfur cluster assembly accessory protein [Wenzhouxiangellaceae bacterium]